MPGVSISPAGISIEQDWNTFKTFVNGTVKSLSLQYVDEGNDYLVFAVDGRVLYYTTIYKAGFEPSGFTGQQITDNSTYRTDFVNNFQSTANKQTVAAQSNSAKHYNGTATTTPATVTFTPAGKSIFIHNTASSGNLLLSFDAGTTFKTILPGATFSIDAGLASVVVKASTGSVTYESVVAS